jgi:hypothetical protein
LIVTIAFAVIVTLGESDFLWESVYQRGQGGLFTALRVLNLSWFAFLVLQAAFLIWVLAIAAATARRYLASSR